MKKLFTGIHVPMLALAGLMLSVPRLQAAPRDKVVDANTVVLPHNEAARLAEILEKVLYRAPRFDAPELGDPDFPPLPLDVQDIEDVRRIVCLIQDQLEECCSVIDEIHSKVCVIDSKIDFIGDPCDEPIDFPSEIDICELSNTKASVFAWLKTIVKELRGLNGECLTGNEDCPHN